MKFKYHRWFQWLVVPFVALAFRIYFGYRIIGRENIPEGGCVVCPNHIQLSDPPFAAVALSHRTPLRLMASKELFQGNKLFAWLIAALGAFPVDREGADITAIKTALSSVKAGQKLIIFPQGTRGAAEGETKKGAAMLAVKSRGRLSCPCTSPRARASGAGRPSSSARRSRPTRKRRSTVRLQMTSSAASTR